MTELGPGGRVAAGSVVAGLDVCGVSVDLGGRPVLRDVDLVVRPGELVGLLGPNGAGKTTLLRAILGLVRVVSGRITVGEQSVAGTPRRRRAIGYVPQRHEFAWDFPVSVDQAVMSGLAGRLGVFGRTGVAHWSAVAEAVERVGLTELRDRPVGELSGGQRQRVLVARALALETNVLLLDEPFTGLDLPTQELLARLFVELAAEGEAILMTTHDLMGALTECSRLVLLNRTVVADGPPGELGDPSLWATTFGVDVNSPFLRVLEGL